jgi:hypothetical protein
MQTSLGPLVNRLLLARPVAMVACVVAAALALVFTAMVGRRNPSPVLMLLFTFWVSSPFVALGVGAHVSRNWSVRTRAALHAVMLAVSFLSPCIYAAVALGPPRAQPAFIFLVVPLASWVLCLAILVVVAINIRRRA